MEAVKNHRKRPAGVLSLVCFVVGVVGMGWGLGLLTGPDAWYANLAKPWFTPPNSVFAPVWTALYVMIAVAGWRVWRLVVDRLPFGLWILQMVLNGVWSPLFFLAHQPGMALFIITLLLVTVLFFIIRTQKHDRVAAGLFIPYAIWTGIATVLNAAIYGLNQAG
ncbi:TPA: TspO/MBR family protein [Serratia fonticola]